MFTRAPGYAHCRVQNGAAIACSSESTVMPSSGRFAETMFKWPEDCEEIVASGPQRGAAGAQLPECTLSCMRIASTAQAPIRHAQ